MFTTDLYFDRPVSKARLADAFAQALRIPSNHVTVVSKEQARRATEPWFPDWASVALQTSSLRGDFPFVVELFSRPTLDLRETLETVSQALGVAILTDELVVNPLFTSEWLMFTPGGDAVVIETDGDEFGAEEPAIILTPQSRSDYMAHQPHSGRFVNQSRAASI